MSAQRSRQGTSRTNDQSHTSSLPASLLPHLRQPPSPPPLDDDGHQPVLPEPLYVPTRPILPSISPILHSTSSSSMRRQALSSLRGEQETSGHSRSTSADSGDFDNQQHFSTASQYRRDTTSNVRAAPPPQLQMYHPLTHTHDPSAPARPPSAPDSAYLSDLSTLSAASSTPDAPPASLASAGTSSDSSYTSGRSWGRSRGQTIRDRSGASVSPISGSFVAQGLGAAEDDVQSATSSRMSQSHPAAEYEPRRTRFPTSTMRGGSSRSYTTLPGVGELSRPQRGWGTDEYEYEGDAWSDSEQDAEMLIQVRGRGRARVFRGSAPYRGNFSGTSLSTSPSMERFPPPNRSIQDQEPSATPLLQNEQYSRWTSRNNPEPRQASDLSPGQRLASGGTDTDYHSYHRHSETHTSIDTDFGNNRPSSRLPSTSGAGPSRRSTRQPVYAYPSARTSENPRAVSRSSSPTSLPRYSAYSLPAPQHEVREEVRYAHQSIPLSSSAAPQAQFTSAYTLSPVAPSQLSQSPHPPYRSYTFPAVSDERAYSGGRYSPAYGASSGLRSVQRSPGQDLPQTAPISRVLPPLRTLSEVRHPIARAQQEQIFNQPVIQGQEQGQEQRHQPSDAPAPGYALSSPFERHGVESLSEIPVAGSDSSRTLAPTSASALQQHRTQSSPSDDMHVRYPYPPEAPPLAPQAPLPWTTQVDAAHRDSPPAAKRVRTVGTEGEVFDQPMLPSPTPGGKPTAATEAGRGRKVRSGRDRSRENLQASTSTSRSGTRTVLEPAVFPGRGRSAHNVASDEGSLAPSGPPAGASSVSPPIPSVSRRIEPSIRPQLLDEVGGKSAPPPVAGPSSRPPEKKRGKAKGKGRDTGKQESVGPSAPEDAPGLEAEEDEDDDDDDDYDGPEFVLGAAPEQGRTGRRAPRVKIEVACDFCRKRKMRCDGMRPSCKNCSKRNEACTYINEVRRRGPGKKQKAVMARPKKTNKAIEAGASSGSDRRQSKGKGKGKAQSQTSSQTPSQTPEQAGEVPTTGRQSQSQSETPRTPPTQVAGTADYSLGTPTQRYLSGFSSTANTELFLPSALDLVSPPRPGGLSSLLSPLQPSTHPLAPYSPTPMSFYVHNSPHGFGTELFFPGQSPMFSGADVIDPVDIGMAGGSGTGNRAGESSTATTARKVSALSSGPSSSEGEPKRRSGRRRATKRAKVDRQENNYELEEGEIREAGSSSAQQQTDEKNNDNELDELADDE